MSDELKDEWIPESTATPVASEPLVEREWAGSGLRLCFVHVRLANVERTRKWIEIKAKTLDDAVKAAEAMPEVEVCFEASFIPGGVVT